MRGKTNKKMITLITAFVCVMTCAVFFVPTYTANADTKKEDQPGTSEWCKANEAKKSEDVWIGNCTDWCTKNKLEDIKNQSPDNKEYQTWQSRCVTSAYNTNDGSGTECAQGGVRTAFGFYGCENNAKGVGSSTNAQNPIYNLLLVIINFVSVGVGILATAGVIYGAVLYGSSGGAPERSKKGITYMINSGIALVMFALMWSFLNFIIPGGIFT